MLKNYITIAVRHLTRHKLFSVINIFCLALGLAFSLIILVYVIRQEHVNSDLRDVNNQYLLHSKWKIPNMGLEITTLGPLAKTMRDEYPGLVADYYRYNPVINVVSAGDKHFKVDISIGDTTLVSMFGFPLLYGNKEHAFANDNSAVITEAMAMKLFGRKDVINEVINIQTTVNGATQVYSVSAVLKDLPYNSVTGLLGDEYSVYLPTTGNRYYQGGDPTISWSEIYEIGFVELKPGIKSNDLEEPFKRVIKKYNPEFVAKKLSIDLQPIKSFYMDTAGGAVKKTILTLSLIAAFILLMAVINFININIGTSSYRLKEIGLRKVFGGAKIQLVIQFMTEAMLLTGIAAIISLFMYEMLLPSFDQVLKVRLESLWQFGFSQLWWLLMLILVVGFISGVYPAFVLSSADTILSVKGKNDKAKGGLGLRKVLLVIQFSTAIIVFICALNVSKQVSYFFNKDPGYNKDQLLVITAFPKQWDSAGVIRIENIRQGLMQLGVVKDATVSFEIPERKPPNTNDFTPLQKNADHRIVMPTINADENYASTYGLQLNEGSFFTHGGSYVPGQIVINESAEKELGLTPGAAVGKKIQLPAVKRWATVAGVVKDYFYAGMQTQIEPVAFMHINDTRNYRYLTVKIKSPDIPGAINKIRNKYKEMSPGSPFEYFFMDEKYKSLYSEELQLKKAADIASVLNLAIVLMGIFGVVAFTLNKRTKEIAMRKVLGAGAGNIIFLFIKEYALLILLANMIAWPFAYQISGSWLQNYAERVDQNAVPYLLVGAFVFISAFILIIAQCYKVAMMNPVNSLRVE
jgi:putative ABC transport system permease protein